VRCAVRANGRSPADEALTELYEGILAGDLDRKADDPWPDESQPGDFFYLVNVIRHFAEHGEPRRRSDINSLRDGTWEFRRSKKRLSFFDTPGDGTYSPKPRIRDRKDATYEDSDFWWIPEFDQEIRLGHFFLKDSQQTEETDISECLAVREEDVEHDRQEDPPQLAITSS
jgi:hypothetical protein